MLFFDLLHEWYANNKRSLPWRSCNDPYKIWLSEVILQQTRIDQGTSYYLKFIDHYPNVQALASATEDDVLKDWQGLGYYSRARNLHSTAKHVVVELDGEFPQSYSDLLKLKGVGKYTAAAIASFCFDEVVPAVDGNVYRVLTRIFGIETPIDTSKGAKEIEALAWDIINKDDPATYNQAMMEFGALHCTPKAPKCKSCPFENQCIAYKTNKTDLIPIKSKKIKQRDRFFNYLVITHNHHTYLNKRITKGIWQNLYDFPLIETSKPLNPEELFDHNQFKELFKGSNATLTEQSLTFKHVLSHQIIRAVFWEIKLDDENQILDKYLRTSFTDFSRYAVPRLIENYAAGKSYFH